MVARSRPKNRSASRSWCVDELGHRRKLFSDAQSLALHGVARARERGGSSIARLRQSPLEMR
jgi:hypothetical protein